MKKNTLSENQLSAFSLYAGSILSGISFLMQLFLSSPPNKGEHIFTYYANQILLNSNVSMLSALFSFFGSIAIAFGIFSLNQFIQKKSINPLMNLSVFLFVISSIGFVISRAHDLLIIWGSPGEFSNNMMVEFALIFSFGLFYWLGIAVIAYCLKENEFLNDNFLLALSIVSIFNFLLIIYTIFNVDPYDGSTLVPLYTGFTIGNILVIFFCFLSAKKLINS